MSPFVSNHLIGWIGGFYEKMSPSTFWTIHAHALTIRGEKPAWTANRSAAWDRRGRSINGRRWAWVAKK
jgi:hypothetical protein